MERESFQNPAIAALLNESFISIDIDRERRPDIDAIYMAACLAMTGHGGWPLTALLTHQQQPFFIGTYLPPDALMKLLTETKQQWPRQQGKYASLGAQLTEALRDQFRGGGPGMPLDRRMMMSAVKAYAAQFDREYGGTGIAPKFPMPQTLLFLLRYAALSGDALAKNMAETTLERMCEGAIFDHIGGGFMRYATDRRWLVPHFEKLLIDNALLAMVYLEAWLTLERPLYLDVAERTLQYVMREMTDAEGGFCSSQDADAGGQEGAFYAIGKSDAIAALGQADGEAFAQYFSLEPDHLPNRIGHSGGISTRRMAHLCDEMQAYRMRRMPLSRDDKLITAWNGWMIAALCMAYTATAQRKYLEAAVRAADCARKRLTKQDGTLYISCKDGKPSGEGLLDDYAALANGYLALYRSTLADGYLNDAIALARIMLERFEDRTRGGFYMTPGGGEKLLVRPRETADGAHPSGNAAALSVLVTLSILDVGVGWTEAAERQMRALTRAVSDNPLMHCATLHAAMPLLFEPTLLSMHAGDADRRRVLEALQAQYLPLVYLKASKPGAQGKSFRLCKGRTCYAPFQEVEAVLAAL